jgi:protease I
MKLTGKKIAFLVAEGVEDLEYHVVAMRLQEEGAEVLTAGLDLKPLHGKNGLVITPDTLIKDLKADELFALVLPGGWGGLPRGARRRSSRTAISAPGP